MTYDPGKAYLIQEDKKPRIGSKGFVADSWKQLKTMVEVENINCYGELTSVRKGYPYGYEIDHDGLYWSCFYEVENEL